MASKVTGESLDRLGPTAIVSYISLAIFAATAIGVFALVVLRIEVTAVMAGILGTILGASAQGASTTQGFWLGGNIGTKQATTALAQVAGQPTASAPAATSQTVVVQPPGDEFAIPPKPGDQP